MIEVTDLYKSFGTQEVLKGIDLTIDDGDIVALLGASGSGKSVMLRNLVGLMTPDRGSVKIDGDDVHAASGRKLDVIRDKIGMLFQGGALFDSMSAFENLAFPLRETTDMSRDEIEERVRRHLEMVGMKDAGPKYPAELSGGMQKRVALARTLVMNPEYVFFDEPTTGLDPLIANSILRLIMRLHEDLEFTAIIVTHNFQKVFPIVQKVAMLYSGEIVAYETPETFMENDLPAVAEFVREALEGPLEGEEA